MAKPIYVLGTGLSHNGSAVLLKDGRVAFGIEKERITRRKRDGGNDTEAVRYCLHAEGIGIDDLDLVVQCANFEVPDPAHHRGPRLFGGVDSGRFRSVSHHLAHAYSAAGACPFGDANVLVIDGCGSPFEQCIDAFPEVLPAGTTEATRVAHLLEKDSFYRFDGQQVAPLWKDFSPVAAHGSKTGISMPTTEHSIGGFYAAVSHYCLGDVNAAGKLMGLAPYGRHGVVTGEAFVFEEGRTFVAEGWRDSLAFPNRQPGDFKRRFQHYADVAAWAQARLEEAVLTLIRHRQGRFPHPKLCFTGGVALNAVANAQIRKQGLVEELFIEPAAGDHGLALGCAYYGWLEVLGESLVPSDGSTCFGKSYHTEKVRFPAGAGLERTLYADDGELVGKVARMLTDGLVVGWFQGGSEFGPRALGRRSILASPFKVGVRDFINGAVKFREDFRPFAPAILKEDCPRFFENAWDSPYMILVDDVRSEWRGKLGEVSHLDGTARVQTVTPDWNPRFHALLVALRELTGNGILLNTSFNRRGMPIVETPGDAVEFFLGCGLDALVVEREIVTKSKTETGRNFRTASPA